MLHVGTKGCVHRVGMFGADAGTTLLAKHGWQEQHIISCTPKQLHVLGNRRKRSLVASLPERTEVGMDL